MTQASVRSRWLIVENLKKSIKAVHVREDASVDWRKRRLVCIARAAVKTLGHGSDELSVVATALYVEAQRLGYHDILERFSELNLASISPTGG